jgi:nuclear receptor interaction protein
MHEEQGIPGRTSSANSMSEHETELMGAATRCVRKFAPEGRKKMRRTDNGHITACKISDANPNEMIASWSGDHIYSFDLVRSPDAGERGVKGANAPTRGNGKGRVRESSNRKRKWRNQNSASSLETGSKSPNPRRAVKRPDEDSDLALRVRYENGQSEDINMAEALPSLPSSMIEEAQSPALNDSQKRSLQIAKSLAKIRKLLFSLELNIRGLAGAVHVDPANHGPSYTTVLGTAATCLPVMDEISRSWRYPVDPQENVVMLQRALRAGRDSSRRFVQACGTLARLLGSKVQNASPTPSPALDLFQNIVPAPHEGPDCSVRELFCYDFIKAIILWLEGGLQALLQGFKRPPDQRSPNPRFPIPEDAQLSGIDDFLIPHLLELSSPSPIPNVDASRFEKDDTRKVFQAESDAVIAFSHAIRLPLQDLSRAVMPTSGSHGDCEDPLLQDKKTALRYWGFKVGRGILMNAGEGLNYKTVDTAFGGLGTTEIEEGRDQEDINPNEQEDVVESISLIRQPGEAAVRGFTTSSVESVLPGGEASEGASVSGAPIISRQGTESDIDIEDADSDAEVILMDDLHDEIADHMAAEDANTYDDGNEDTENEDSDADDDDDGDITAEERQFMFRSASDRGKLREMVERDTPCYSHTRQYRGHCNVKTVKDANFFGLHDEVRTP